MRNFLIACAVLIGFSSAAFAAKPAELTPAIHAAAPVGQASLNKLFFHVYDAQLWSDSGDWKSPPYALVLVYGMGFSNDDLADRTYDEMRNVSKLPDETLKNYADQLRKIYPAVKEGDRITALQKTKETTVFYYNGKVIGQIQDAKFASAFFGIWLSPKSSEPTMQRKLLPSS